MEFYYAISIGLSIGALGSLHCVGMCGPLALSLPFNRLKGFEKMNAILLYNAGRLITYSVMGLAVGFIGRGFSFFGWQQWLSIVAGVFILAVLIGGNSIKPFGMLLQKTSTLVSNSLASSMQKSQRSIYNFFVIGILNGLLPCGLVYIALAMSVSMDKHWQTILLMGSFGLGTFPLMLLTIVAGNLIRVKSRLFIKKITPWLIGFSACLLIIRGLGLGIPYLSPQYPADAANCVPVK
jgi:uncharacterized protein